MNKILTEITEKEQKKQDIKSAQLLKAFENNLKISGLRMNNKFRSFENWEYIKSTRLLYEIGLSEDKRYKRYPKGSIIKVDFGVNVGGEFSEQHFAITLSKGDRMYNNTIIVVPLTSKKHKNTIDLGKLISDSYIQSLQNQIEKIQQQMQEIDIEKCEFNSDYIKEINEIGKILKYYKKIKNNFSYACIDQIRTVSKLNILPPINKYDIVGNYVCSKEVMDNIDKHIIKIYTSIDFVAFENFLNNQVIKN